MQSRRLIKTWSLRDTAMLTLLLAVAMWMHRLALLDILAIGIGSEEQSHILLAPVMAGWLFWLRRSRLRSLRTSYSLWGPALVVAGWFASWIGVETDTQVAWHGGALVTLLGCIVSMTGLAFVRQFAPAFLAMVFLIPIPGFMRTAIAMPLQEMATVVTQSMLELIAVPVTRDGSVLILNGERVAVGEACNGMRMVFALGLIVYTFAFSVPLRNSVRGLLLVLSPVAALLSNVIRLIPTTIFFGYGTVENAQVFHDIAGWIMLPVALFMMLGVLRMVRWIELPVLRFRLASP